MWSPFLFFLQAVVALSWRLSNTGDHKGRPYLDTRVQRGITPVWRASVLSGPSLPVAWANHHCSTGGLGHGTARRQGGTDHRRSIGNRTGGGATIRRGRRAGGDRRSQRRRRGRGRPRDRLGGGRRDCRCDERRRCGEHGDVLRRPLRQVGHRLQQRGHRRLLADPGLSTGAVPTGDRRLPDGRLPLHQARIEAPDRAGLGWIDHQHPHRSTASRRPRDCPPIARPRRALRC